MKSWDGMHPDSGAWPSDETVGKKTCKPCDECGSARPRQPNGWQKNAVKLGVQEMKLEGLIAAVHTPLHDDCTVNYEQVPALAAHLAKQQVRGVFVGGTTGESQSLTTSERVKLFNAWGIAVEDNGQTFVAHVGHNSLPDAQALVHAAHDSGADAISAMAPTFFKPADAEALCDWFVELTRPAPGIPFYFYDIPPMSGVTIDTQAFLELASERLPALAGVKYSNPDDELLQSCVNHNGGSANILYGIDERYLHGLSAGCPGAVGSTFNFAAPLYRRIKAAFERGAMDAARSEQARSAQMIRMFKERDYVPTAKAVMTLAGLDCGPVRPPLTRLSSTQIDTLRRDLDAMEFFDWAMD